MTYAADDKKLKAWEDGIQAAVAKNPTAWNTYDQAIKDTIADYTAKLQTVTGYVAPDFNLVKAMLWTESGANSDAWSTAPMQIGVNGDPGLKELLTSAQGKMILPTTYQTTLTTANVPADGTKNVEAGVGYLLKIAAKFDYVAVVPTPPPAPPVAPSVAPPAPAAPPVASLAPKTIEPIKAAPPKGPTKSHHKHAPHVQPKRVLGIVGWREMTTTFVAAHYNAGDGNYSKKLDYCIDLIKNPPKPAPPKAPAAPVKK